jgi:Flp pilus assembly pilin Flp
LRANGHLEKVEMNAIFLKIWVALQSLRSSERGQDLVEYSLLVCLIALGGIAGVRHVATAVTAVFSNVSSSLA